MSEFIKYENKNITALVLMSKDEVCIPIYNKNKQCILLDMDDAIEVLKALSWLFPRAVNTDLI